MKNNVSIIDMHQTLKKINLAFFFAWGDTKARYKRSVLGPFWLVLSTAIGVVGLGFLWSSILKVNYADFFPSLAAGLILWQLISGCVVDAASVFTRNSSLIHNIPLPLGFFGIQLLFKHLVNFAHNLIILVVILSIFPYEQFNLFIMLEAIPGFILLVGNLLWILLLIGLIGARYRDVEPFISSLMPMLFFITPVIYKPNNLGAIQSIAWSNPLTYLITLVRDPLLGCSVPGFVWAYTGAGLIVGWTIALCFINQKYKRLPFWI